MTKLRRGEFSFNGVPMKQTFGVTVAKAHDVLLPARRARKVSIPRRDGRYDYGAQNWEERSLLLECNIADVLTREQVRELAYTLSGKGSIVLWNEPDKRYVGQLYDPQVLDKIAQGQLLFNLEFTCEPFAYSQESVVQHVTSGMNEIQYKGTAPAPALIILRNNSEETIENVQITAVYRR